jgi:putative ubiquitin-RnfH superfamily antitoxin RatB of RatAB toxin-antitoxin module
VVYSPATRQVHEVGLTLRAGASALEALHESGFLESHPELDSEASPLGIWGRKVRPNQVLRENDRLEIYRPLKVDPKVARRERFRKQGARSTGLFARQRPGAKTGY